MHAKRNKLRDQIGSQMLFGATWNYFSHLDEYAISNEIEK